MRKSVIVGLAILAAFGSLGTIRSWSAITVPPVVVESERSEAAFLKYLLPLLKSAGKVARVDYLASCMWSDNFYYVLFPTINVRPPSGRETGIAAIREILRGASNVIVAESEPGIVHIKIGDVPNAILDTKISRLNLDPYDQYDSIQALRAIDGADEVISAGRQLRVELANADAPFNGAVVQPREGLPHLPSSLSNMTMEQALGDIAKTFDVVVFYAACTEPALFTTYAKNTPG